MARVVLQDGRELDVPDSDVGALDYYRGVGAEVTLDAAEQSAVFPIVYENGERVELPAAPDVEATASDDGGNIIRAEVTSDAELAGDPDDEADRPHPGPGTTE